MGCQELILGVLRSLGPCPLYYLSSPGPCFLFVEGVTPEILRSFLALNSGNTVNVWRLKWDARDWIV